MILPCLLVAPTDTMGRGIFTTDFLPAGMIIEISPVIVLQEGDREHIDKTILHDYIFEWQHERASGCMALGYISIYNHSNASNCEYEMDYDTNLIKVTTVRDIAAGEELFINYNGNWNDATPLWFKLH